MDFLNNLMSNKQIPEILIVEDDQFMIRILTREFNQAGLTKYEIISNGKEVVKKFKKYKPDLVVLDILLPGKNGLEALKEIRGLKEGKDTPVFILTNYGNQEYRGLALELNVKDYLIKSNTLVSELIQKIKSLWLQRHDRPVGAIK